MRKTVTIGLAALLFLLTAEVSGQELSAEQQEAVQIIKMLNGSLSQGERIKVLSLCQLMISGYRPVK